LKTSFQTRILRLSGLKNPNFGEAEISTRIHVLLKGKVA